MQLELSSRTETEQEARSKSSCYNFETLSTQIFQCNCFFSAATGPPPGYSSRRDSSRQPQSQRVEILSGGVFLILPNFSQHTHETFIKFVLSKKATKIDEIFTVDLTVCMYCQIDVEDFVKFCGLLRKHELYQKAVQNIAE